MTFANYIKQAREAQGLSLRTAAGKAGMSASRLSQLELGRGLRNSGGPAISDKLLKSLAKALKVNPEELLIVAGKVPKDIAGALCSDPSCVGAVRAALGKKPSKSTK